MRTTFWIEPSLGDRFGQEGLEDFGSWMDMAMGVVVSSVPGSEVRRVEVGNDTFYLKRRSGEPAMRLLALVLFGRRPMSGPLREFRMLQALAGHGFRVMVPVAWGEARRLGIPREGFLVVRSVPGRSVLQVYRDGSAEDREVQEKLNDRPRKCLGWRTPREVYSDQAAIVALPG